MKDRSLPLGDRGAELLLSHCAPLTDADLSRPPALRRLEELLGGELARLLVGVDVQRQLVLGGVAPELLEPVARAGTDGVGGDPDANPVGPQLLDLTEIRGH